MKIRVITIIGVILGTIYLYAISILTYGIVSATGYAFSFIRENANFTLFTTGTYFRLYSPYAIGLIICFLLLLHLIIYLVYILKRKFLYKKNNIIILISSLFSFGIFACVPSSIFNKVSPIPVTETIMTSVNIENIFLMKWNVPFWIAFAIFLICLFCIISNVILNKNADKN